MVPKPETIFYTTTHQNPIHEHKTQMSDAYQEQAQLCAKVVDTAPALVLHKAPHSSSTAPRTECLEECGHKPSSGL